MSDYRLLLENVELSDSEAVKAMQKKLNQWKTQGNLLKFSTVTAGSYALFTIALRTKAKVEKQVPATGQLVAEDDESPF